MPTFELISPQQLRRYIDRHSNVVIVDTRPESDFNEWHLDGATHFRFTSESSFDREDFMEATGADATQPILTICAKGEGSRALAERLSAAGYESVASVQDGMRGWSRVYELQAVPTRDPEIDIMQLHRPAKGCLGYVVGWGPSEEAAVIDPTRHVDQFIDVTADTDHEITHVIDTHIHADHISSGRALATEVGADYYLSERATERDVRFEYTPLARNQVLEVGDIELKAIPTPGHTAEMTSLLVNDEAIFTGDTLFVDAVGRTELQYGSGLAAEGAEQLFESLHRTILALPDAITVLPGHASDSFQFTTDPIFSSIGALRTSLPILQVDRETFVSRVTEELPPKPPNFETIIDINLGAEDPPDQSAAVELELGPNRCAVADD